MEIIDHIRTIGWYNAVARAAGMKSAYALSNHFEDLRSAKVESDENKEVKSFTPYATGKRVPSDITLDMVEKLLPKTKAVFTIGLPSNSGHAPLWLAIGGSKQAIQSVLTWFDKELGQLQVAGASMRQLTAHLTERWMPEKYVLNNMLEAHVDPSMHYVAYMYSENKLQINMDELTALVALWRLSMITNSEYPYLAYFMEGFIQKAIPDLLRPYGLDEAFPKFCELFTANHLKNLKLMEEGKLGDRDRS